MLMDVHLWQIVAVFFLTLGASIFSGMAGGGGFIVLPVLIALGLSPKEAVATAKLSAFGIGVGSIAAFKKRSFENRKLLIFLLILSVLISLIVPHIFQRLSGKTYQIILAIIILCFIPVILNKKRGLEKRPTSRTQKIIGGVLISFVFLIQGVFSGGVGSLNNILLISFFGLSALQASAIRRVATLSLNTFIVITLALTTHFIIFKLAIAGMIGSFIGGYIGSHIAIKSGEQFAKYALAAFMLFSGIVLLATALA